MDTNTAALDDSPAASEAPPEQQIRLRSYQQEMLEASLNRNVIVVMETGSGKTHVAVSRIRAELEGSQGDKLVWFLTPKVALAEQQYQVLKTYLPGFPIKSLTGKDGVETWTDKNVWKGFLMHVKVVVGTPKVLEDALTHGFVNVGMLALLVFDEAHNCVGDSPMNVVMRNFYLPAKVRGDKVPHILGLTASPVMSANLGSLATIEANLDALATTPKRFRSALEEYARPPAMTSVLYTSSAKTGPPYGAPILRALARAVDSYDLSTDPYVTELGRFRNEKTERKLKDISDKPNTSCYKNLRALQQRSQALQEQLGASAAEWYILMCVERFNKSLPLSTILILPDLEERERSHLATIFERMLCEAGEETEPSVVTDKVLSLIDILQQHYAPCIQCIVFAEQRAVVTALAHLLRSHSKVGTAYSIGTFVGTSVLTGRKISVADLVEVKGQQQDLVDFREGTKNLMIATNVLEEGIDVAACNLIICFDPPKNLVSFVQRRGRARQQQSDYVLFLPADDPGSNPSKWQRLEAEMKQAYMEENRKLGTIQTENEDEVNSQRYTIKETGAQLTLKNAKAHLYHFCAVGTHHVSGYFDLRPEFDTTNNGGPMPWTANVTLPPFVHHTVRCATSSRAYTTEVTAIKDAAFEAYVALYEAGLVNEHWLPLVKDYGPEVSSRHIDQPSIIDVSERLLSWRELFKGQRYGDVEWYRTALTLSLKGGKFLATKLLLPTPLGQGLQFNLYWSQDITYSVDIQASEGRPLSYTEIDAFRTCTHAILASIFSAYMPPDKLGQLPVLLSQPDGYAPPETQLLEGHDPAAILLQSAVTPERCGLIRVRGQYNRAYIYSGLATSKDTREESEIVVKAFPKRKDFLHPLHDVHSQTQGTTHSARFVLPVSDCTVDRLPTKHAILAAFVPAIMHRLDIAVLAQHMQSGLLADVGISDRSLIVEAVTAPSASEGFDYNRLEFLGDSILKFFAVRQVMAKHLNWPERYLSLDKDKLVSNNFLAEKAQKELDLGRFIVTKPFTGAKWRPIDVSKTTEAEASSRALSSKVMADVMEALVGAAFVDGGFGQALGCIRTLLSSEDWYSCDTSIDRLLQDANTGEQPGLALLEQLVGHHFNYPSLLIEAITHVSFRDNNMGISYERLEFLGDAVLDAVVVPKLFAHSRNLKHWEMHRIREALVCAHLLGYCCMHHRIDEEIFDVVSKDLSLDEQPQLRASTRAVHLHDFLRAGAQLMKQRQEAIEDFENVRADLDKALEYGLEYPWPELIALNPPKFFSDLVESVLGAIYLDTRGDLSLCEAFVKKLGILKHMRRILEGNVETASPKEQLGILAGNEEVKYSMSLHKTKDQKRNFTCLVTVGGSEVAFADDCKNKDEAGARSARAAVRTLQAKLGAESGNRKRKLDVVMKENFVNHEEE